MRNPSAQPTHNLSGTFRPHPRGFGFIDLDTPVTLTGDIEVDSAFVPPPAARNLLDSDHVQFTATADDRGLALATTREIARRRRLAVGTLTSNNGRWTLDLHPTCGTGTLTAAGNARGQSAKAGSGRLVTVAVSDNAAASSFTEIVATPARPGTPDAARQIAAVRAFGAPTIDELDDDTWPPPTIDETIEAAWAHTLVAATPYKVERSGRKRGGPIPGSQLERVDLRAVPTVTIDGPSTKDLDDAISAQPLPNGQVRIYVHIADVAAAIAPGSDLDIRAATLATSVYLAGHVAPMLPPHLSEDALSLMANTDRDTLTVAFNVTEQGALCDVEIFPSLICSNARLTYERVGAHLDGKQQLPATQAATIDAAAAAADLLEGERDSRATLEDLFTSPQAAVTIEDGVAVQIAADEHAPAQLLIERLMVAANEAVAGWLDARNVPTLYRTHTGVNPYRTDMLDAAAVAADVTIAGHDAADLLDALGDATGREHQMLTNAVTFSLDRAAYTTGADHHFGLDSKPYTHFTSPIRRYADLIVHRTIRATLAGEQAYTTGELARIAGWITARSGQSARAEAAERDLLWAQLLGDILAGGGDVIEDATVSKLTPAGVVLRIGRVGVRGFLPAGGRGRKLDLREDALATTDGTHHVGQTTRVRLTSVEDGGQLVFAAA